MKKRAWILALVLCVSVMAGCNNKTESKDKEPEKQTSEVTEDVKEDTKEEKEDPTTAELLADIDVAKCVTLGEYKGITLEKTIEQVTDEQVEAEIRDALLMYPVEQEGRKAQLGDTVNIDYVGRLDGEEFEGGSDQGANLKLGSGQFIAGFEDGLVGAGKGETKTLNLTFPSDYTPELAGKAVEFTVTVNAVKTPLEEPTDEWVAANFEGYHNLEEYRASIRSEQEETNRQTAEEQLRNSAWMKVVDSCTINEYPETLVEMGKKLYEMQAMEYAAYAGMDLEAFIEASGITKEEYHANQEEFGKDVAAQAMINEAICQAEGFKIGDEKYKEELSKMEAEYGMTEEELLKAYKKDNVEQSIMMNRVTTLILDHAIITEVKATPEPPTETAGQE